jgi:hypothetical protein
LLNCCIVPEEFRYGDRKGANSRLPGTVLFAGVIQQLIYFQYFNWDVCGLGLGTSVAALRQRRFPERSAPEFTLAARGAAPLPMVSPNFADG